jgi:deferrochelatase/peroxidase EfeB
VLVSVLLLAVLGKGHFILREVVDFVQAVSQAVGLSFFGVVDTDIRFEVELRVETVIREEGGKAGRLGGMVIGSEFGYGEELGPVVLLIVYICL